MEILIRKKNVVLDATVLTSLMNCANFVDLRFNRRFVSMNGKSNSLECGSIGHKYLEVFYKSRIAGLKLDESFALGYQAAQLYIMGCKHCSGFVPSDILTKPVCGHEINEYPGVDNTPMEPSKDKPWQIGWKFVLQTLEEHYKFWRNDSWVPIEVEVVKSKVLFEDDDMRVLWKAKLDLVVDTDKGLSAVDHKTMKQNRSTTKLNNQFIGQNLIMDTRTMFINKVGFQKTLPPEKKFLREPKSYDADTLLEWQTQTLPFYARMLLAYNEMGYWPMNHTNCQGKFGDCSYLKVCEAIRSDRERVLREEYMIGPEWNPTNENSDED